MLPPKVIDDDDTLSLLQSAFLPIFSLPFQLFPVSQMTGPKLTEWKALPNSLLGVGRQSILFCFSLKCHGVDSYSFLRLWEIESILLDECFIG